MKNIEIEKLQQELDVIDTRIDEGEVSDEEFNLLLEHRKSIISKLSDLGIYVMDDMMYTRAPEV